MSRVRYHKVEDEDDERMTLPSLSREGWKTCERLYLDGQLQVVVIKNKKFALNFKSENPMNLKNREQRARWATVVGLLANDVERYVRRIKDKQKRAWKAKDIESAKNLLLASGYKVEAP